MRRLFPLLLLVLCLPLSLLSCHSVTEEEVLPAARALLESAALINDTMIGEGAPRGEGGFEGYDFVSEEWGEETGIYTVSDLRAAVLSVYTEEVAEILFRKALTTSHEVLADYRDRAAPGRGLLILSEREGWYSGETREYLYDTMVMTASSSDTATVTVDVRISAENIEAQIRTLTLPLVRGADGWRCDKLTYIAPLILVD